MQKFINNKDVISFLFYHLYYLRTKCYKALTPWFMLNLNLKKSFWKWISLWCLHFEFEICASCFKLVFKTQILQLKLLNGISCLDATYYIVYGFTLNILLFIHLEFDVIMSPNVICMGRFKDNICKWLPGSLASCIQTNFIPWL